MLKQNQQPFILEITVLSAEGLSTNCSSTLFSRRIRPFITFTTVPPSPYNHHSSSSSSSSKGDKKCHVYRTRVDDEGGTNPRWGDKFDVPLDHSFCANRYSTIHLQLYTKRLIVGQAQLGSCQIPVYDFGSSPVGTVRYLSYRLRARDGSRGPAIVNLAVKLQSFVPVSGLNSDTCHTVVGIPVTVFPRAAAERSRL
ncbi:hypothetical protein ACJW30_10G061500 [Castanea mollissima]